MYSFSNICRICIQQTNKLVNIHSIDGDLTLNEKLKLLIPEMDFDGDNLPNSVCNNCCSKLQCFYDFKQLCLKSNMLLHLYKSNVSSAFIQNLQFQSMQIKKEEQDDGSASDYVKVQIEEMQVKIDGERASQLHVKSDYDSEDITKDGNEEKFQCLECGRCCSSKSNLRIHVKIHTDEKPHKCDTCGQSFRKLTNLKAHIRIHTGEKPFHCETCGQFFSHQNTLRDHMRIHTGEKPFKCDVCTKCFRRHNDLKRHLVFHSGKKTFKCDTCGQCFSRLDGLKVHIRIHTGEKPFKCTFCEQHFRQQSGLSHHVKHHHPNHHFIASKIT